MKSAHFLKEPHMWKLVVCNQYFVPFCPLLFILYTMSTGILLPNTKQLFPSVLPLLFSDSQASGK